MIIRLSANEWAACSENMHRAVFRTEKPSHFDRLDYVWLVVDERTDTALGYVTVHELDHETAHWQFGGVFDWARKSILVARAYDECLKKQSKLSKRVTTVISAKNTRMLKLALSRQWEIFGARNWNGETMVELKKEFISGNDGKLSGNAQSKANCEEAAD